MNVVLTNEQKVTVTLNPTTAGGHPAKLDGVPAWNVLDGNSTVAPAEDGMSAVITSSDSPTVTNIQVTADGDLGEGVRELTLDLAVVVTEAGANDLGGTVGTPELK